MQLITFNIGNECYAIDTALVVEIIPLITIRPVVSCRDFIRGVIDYRGTVVPVIDMGLLLEQHPAAKKVSTRILVIRYQPGSQAQRLLGLIAERATGIFHVDSTDIERLETTLARQQFLGGMFNDGDKMVQVIDPQGAVSQALEQALDLPGMPGNDDTEARCAPTADRAD